MEWLFMEWLFMEWLFMELIVDSPVSRHGP
jgi:hypothetical protein